MIDSRAKGRTAESNCRDELRKLTPHKWERTPLSGALDAKHQMKGDLYVPQTKLKYCVEVKHYADDHVNTQLLTSTKPILLEWWAQACSAAEKMGNEPLLIFKHNRSKWFAAYTELSVYFALLDAGSKLITWHPHGINISLLTDFCKHAEFV
jgi:hypothetical protein